MGRTSQLRAPLRYRNFRLIWLAQLASELGDWAGRLALAVIVEQRTGSALMVALVTAATIAPFVGIGQALSARLERFPRKRVLVFADLGRAIIFSSLALPVAPWVLLVGAFAAGV